MTSTVDATERLARVEARLRLLEDKETIRDVLHRYARSADRCDLELFKSCYWPDATDVHWFYNGNAHDFADWVIPVLAEIDGTQHSVTNPIIELHGDRAFVESHVYVVHHIPFNDGSGRFIDQQTECRYVDVFEKRDDEWRILRRQVVLDSLREFVVPNPFAEAPRDMAGQRAPHDVIYQGMSLLNQTIIQIPGMDLWDQTRARHTS